MKTRIISFIAFIASILHLHLVQGQADSTQTDTPNKLQSRATDISNIRRLPDDPKLHLSPTLDLELERLLQGWYEGYTRMSTNPYNGRGELMSPAVHDSVYIKMLDKLPSAIRMSYNDLVREGIELYLYKRRSLLSSMLSLGDLYFPEIEIALDRNKLPLELKYLAVVESALNPSAVSPMGAAGLWQLMLPTGRIYGLTINSLIDERLDPIKSTEAACKLLKELYKIYNDWFLVMAAYNCGPGNVNKAIRRAGVKTPTFWNVYPYLPKETRRYVPLFIGAYFAMYYHKEMGVQRRLLGKPLATEYYSVTEALSFDKLSQISGVSRELIATYNPHFKRGIIPGNIEPYMVRLPLSGIMHLANTDVLPISLDLAVEVTSAERPENAHNESKALGKEKGSSAKKVKYHTVKKGQTLHSIARQYKVSVKQIQQWNGLRTTKLKAGQRLIVGK